MGAPGASKSKVQDDLTKLWVKLVKSGDREQADRIDMIAGELAQNKMTPDQALDWAERAAPGGIASVQRKRRPKVPDGPAPGLTIPQVQDKLKRALSKADKQKDAGTASEINRISIALAKGEIEKQDALDQLAILNDIGTWSGREFASVEAAQAALDALRKANPGPADYLQISELQAKLFSGQGITPSEVMRVGWHSGAKNWLGKKIARSMPPNATRARVTAKPDPKADRTDEIVGLFRLAPGRNVYTSPGFGGKPNNQMALYSTTPIDGGLTEIAKMQGWTTPQVGTKSQVQDKIDAGWVEIWRGVKPAGARDLEDYSDVMRQEPTIVHIPAKSGTELMDELRNDPDFGLGSGIYGNGLYFSVDQRAAQSFATTHAPSHGGRRGAYTRAALSPDAKVIDYNELTQLHQEWLADLQRKAKSGDRNQDMATMALYSFTNDPGRWAAMRGYDAIRVPAGLSDGAMHNGRELKAEQYVVLNRTKLFMEDKDTEK